MSNKIVSLPPPTSFIRSIEAVVSPLGRRLLVETCETFRTVTISEKVLMAYILHTEHLLHNSSLRSDRSAGEK